tara:strand:+ start:513 stop:1373 length:861 start_codon:yes stop_codon:yes gene_type:complete
MKPKLLLNAGFPSTGTTSLYYTLWTNKYGHGGHCKENDYLINLQSPHLFEIRNNIKKNNINFSEGVERPWDLPQNVFLNYQTSIFPLDIENLKIEKYIVYYLDLWERIKDEYQSIMDFSNTEQQLSEKFMLSIRENLLKNFDIKIVMTLRDPINRLWSFSNRRSLTQGGDPQSWMKKYFDDSNISYSGKYKRYVRVWGEDNVKVIINEDFYAGQTQPLSDFLEHDMAPTFNEISHLSNIKRKVYSNWCEIDLKTWKDAFENMSWVYDEFEKTFGYIPDQWGRHSIL